MRVCEEMRQQKNSWGKDAKLVMGKIKSSIQNRLFGRGRKQARQEAGFIKGLLASAPLRQLLVAQGGEVRMFSRAVLQTRMGWLEGGPYQVWEMNNLMCPP